MVVSSNNHHVISFLLCNFQCTNVNAYAAQRKVIFTEIYGGWPGVSLLGKFVCPLSQCNSQVFCPAFFFFTFFFLLPRTQSMLGNLKFRTHGWFSMRR